MTGLDIIGDVHGCADKLRGLLLQLGFHERGNAFTHPDRQAVFVGDFIDRGPQQLETLRIVRSMVDAGMAQTTMGNHEFNAIAYATPDPKAAGEFMRPRNGPKGTKNRKQHAAFLEAIGEDSKLHHEYVEWFKTMPQWLDLDEIRVIHACWHRTSIEALAGAVDRGVATSDEFWIDASTNGGVIYEAVETILKGPEFKLGGGRVFVDKDRHERREARIRWWNGNVRTLREIAEIPPGSTTPDGQPFSPLPDTPSSEAERYRYQESEPVFYGHYWRTGPPALESPNAVCVDYSAVKSGPLVAYRWDGETAPIGEKLVSFNCK